MKKAYYYLFGARITQIYFDSQDFAEVIKLFKDPAIDRQLFKYIPKEQDPGLLLEASDGWGGFAEISEEEYRQLKEIE